ncbi:6-bladed beta-propeller [Acidobacteriota bacterium]
MKKIGHGALICLLILAFISVLPAQKIKTVNGIEVIVNPKKPKPPKGVPTKLILSEDFSVGGSDDPDQAFSEVTSFVVDEKGSIYAVDMKENNIKVFDALGQYVRTFGEKGQGPGELNMPVNIQITVDKEIMVEDIMNRRLAYFDIEGNFIRNLSVADRTQITQFMFDSQGNSVAREMEVHDGKLLWFVRKYDKDLKSLFEIDQYEFVNPLEGKINPFDFVTIAIFDGRDNLLYGANREYTIKVYSPEGQHFRTIEKEFVPEKITAEDKQRMLDAIPDMGALNLKDRMDFPKNFPPLESFTVDEEGRLIVRSYRKGKGKDVYYLDIFDQDGRFIATHPYQASPRIWKSGKMYSMEENDDGIRIIKRYSVSWEK